MNTETGKVVLVVDDEEDVRVFLAAVLEDAGFTAVCAADGDEALARMRERVPDLVSLDLVMPRKSGIRFMHELRRSREWSHVPVLVVTGHARDEVGRGDFEHLMDGKYLSGKGSYLEKPVNAATFVAAVRRELGLQPAAEGTRPGPDAKSELRRELGRLIEAADGETLERLRRVLKAESKDGETGGEST